MRRFHGRRFGAKWNTIDAAENRSSSEILGVLYTHPFSNKKKFNRRLSQKSLLLPPTLLELVHVLTSSSHLTLKAKHKVKYSLDVLLRTTGQKQKSTSPGIIVTIAYVRWSLGKSFKI